MDAVPDLLAVYRTLRDAEDSSYLLSDKLRILRTNAGWQAFATANAGEQVLAAWGRGVSVLDAIPAVQREFFRAHFERALATGERWEHDYECSTDRQYREYRMLVFPIRGLFLVVTHSPRVTRAHDRAVSPPDDARYLAQGVITMCAHCRRVHVRGSSARWDWVPAYVTRMPANVSHGLCPPCATFYYDD